MNIPHDALSASRLLDIIEHHAMLNPYRGSVGAGTVVYGWPIAALVDAALPTLSGALRLKLLELLQQKHGRMPIVQTVMPAASKQRYSYDPYDMLAMRMHWSQDKPNPFAHISIHMVSDRCMVWIVRTDGQSIVIEDNVDLFPSDTLVTKLNLMKD